MQRRWRKEEEQVLKKMSRYCRRGTDVEEVEKSDTDEMEEEDQILKR